MTIFVFESHEMKCEMWKKMTKILYSHYRYHYYYDVFVVVDIDNKPQLSWMKMKICRNKKQEWPSNECHYGWHFSVVVYLCFVTFPVHESWYLFFYFLETFFSNLGNYFTITEIYRKFSWKQNENLKSLSKMALTFD